MNKVAVGQASVFSEGLEFLFQIGKTNASIFNKFKNAIGLSQEGFTKLDFLSKNLKNLDSAINSIKTGSDIKSLKNEVILIETNIQNLSKLEEELEIFENTFISNAKELLSSVSSSDPNFNKYMSIISDYAEKIKKQKKYLSDLKDHSKTRVDKANNKIIQLRKTKSTSEVSVQKDVGNILKKNITGFIGNLLTIRGLIELGFVLGVAYYIYNNFTWLKSLLSADEKNKINEDLDQIKSKSNETLNCLNSLQFNTEEDPEAYSLINSMISNLNDSSLASEEMDSLLYSGSALSFAQKINEPSMLARVSKISSDPEKLNQCITNFISIEAPLINTLKLLQDKIPKEEVSTPTDKPRPTSILDKGERNPNDEGIDVLGTKIYLSEFKNLDYATRSAAPVLINKVLLSPTGLSFWDPQGRGAGGYFSKTGPIENQVIEHIRFFLNPRSVDRTWQYGVIDNERKLKIFVRKNLPQVARGRGSEYKETRKDYRRKNKKQKEMPKLYFGDKKSHYSNDKINKTTNKVTNLVEDNFNKNILSTNINSYSERTMNKKADKISKEYYQDALKDLDDQYAKSYYAGLKSMYDEKLGDEKADYKTLYEPLGGSGEKLLEEAYPNSVYVADAKGNGGLVENSSEQHKHNTGVALSIPSGNFRGKYAKIVSELIKIADNADLTNKVTDADLIESTVKDIVNIIKS